MFNKKKKLDEALIHEILKANLDLKETQQSNLYEVINNYRLFVSRSLGVSKTTESIGLTLNRNMDDLKVLSDAIRHAISELTEGNSNVTEQISTISNEIAKNTDFIEALEVSMAAIVHKINDALEKVDSGQNQIIEQEKTTAQSVESFRDIKASITKLNTVAEEIVILSI